ncbi:MAG: adenylate kinase [Dysgonamonadaceae bacterium]|jgi:adenylate kinase|nr:adenylate kinase [Dysgonamonadaceae bacterium]
MLNVVLFGAPGSGKGTHSKLIVEKYGLKHISIGEILREEIAKQSNIGHIASQYADEGKLLPDDLVINILTEAIDASDDAKGFVFDGFPRTIYQGEALEKILRERNTNLAAVLNLDVEETELVARMLARGKAIGRADDNPETIKKRLKTYYDQTDPLKTYYRKKGKLFTIKGDSDIDDVFERISEVFDRLTFQGKK